MILKNQRLAGGFRLLAGWAFVISILFVGCQKRQPIIPTTGISESPESWMRVLLFNNRKECSVSAPNGLVVKTNPQQADGLFIEGLRPIQIVCRERQIYIDGKTFDSPVLLQPREPFVFFIHGDGYRGTLFLSAATDPNMLQAINELPMEAYLLGVVGAEMYSYWEPEALKAQAVAARTYALFSKRNFGKNRAWDVTTTQANQVYRGLSAETATVRDAVEQTSGMVLACPDNNGNKTIFPAYYSSICGGHTEDSVNVFGDSWPCLSPVECPWCRDISKAGFWDWGPVEYSIAEINQKLCERYSSLECLDTIETIEPVRIGQIGRIIGVRIIGKNEKKDFLRGEDFRLALDSTGMRLKSAIFKISRRGDVYVFSDGRGFGHGVGMCQTGAENMARQKYGYAEILEWYFPGSEIVQMPEQQ